MVIQRVPCPGETNCELGANVELTEQTRTSCRQVARELRSLGDSLQSRYQRPHQEAGQNHEIIEIGRNLIEIARFIFIREVMELFGLNN